MTQCDQFILKENNRNTVLNSVQPSDCLTIDNSRGEEWSVCGGPGPAGSVGWAGVVDGGLVSGHYYTVLRLSDIARD